MRHWDTLALCLGRYSRRLPWGRYSIISWTCCLPVRAKRQCFISPLYYFQNDGLLSELVLGSLSVGSSKY